MLSKSDGVMVLHAPGPVKGEMNGIGNANEVESRQETEDAVRIIEKLYARFPNNPA
jgi:hypothetical protein